jgi:flagellum-specific peptidoglycan hydrolase FlgJ
LDYLAFLLHHPKEEYTPLELLHRVGEHVSLVNDGTSEAEEMVDERTKAECQRKWEDLKEQKAVAEQNQDYERVTRLQAEIEAIAHYLTDSTHDGKSKRFPTDAEKARQSVTHRIRDAIKKIATHHDALAQHLSVYIKTGTSCYYNRDPYNSIPWSP